MTKKPDLELTHDSSRKIAESLDEIGRLEGSDKSSLVHGYLGFYENLFKNFRGRKFNLLEFGSSNCAALRMWERFFPLATIVGVFPGSVKDYLSSNVQIEIGSQLDNKFLIHLIAKYDPEIVIDDGLHYWSHQINSISVLFPLLRGGGIYVIEDLQTSFGKAATTYGNDKTQSAVEYVRDLIPGLVGGTAAAISGNRLANYVAFNAEEIIIARQIVAVQKKTCFGPSYFRITPALSCASEIYATENGGSYRRGEAFIFGPRSSYVATSFAEQQDVEVAPPDALVATFKNAIVHGSGIVTTADNAVVKESLINLSSKVSFFGFARFFDSDLLIREGSVTPRSYLSDATYVLLKQTWDDNYGHWLIESLPRVALVAEILDVKSCKFLVGKPGLPMAQVYFDSLAAFGISADQVISTDGAPLHAATLIYPLPLTVQPWVKAPRVTATLERLAASMPEIRASQTSLRKIFVSRLTNGRRRLLNQDQVRQVFVNRGFVDIVPGNMSFNEQVTAFSQAHFIAGPLGAELSNLVFAPRGVRLFGMAPQTMKDDFFYDLVAHKHGSYFCLHGTVIGNTSDMNADFHIDLEELDKILDKFEFNIEKL
jgi:hypothetical protein